MCSWWHEAMFPFQVYCRMWAANWRKKIQHRTFDIIIIHHWWATRSVAMLTTSRHPSLSSALRRAGWMIISCCNVAYCIYSADLTHCHSRVLASGDTASRVWEELEIPLKLKGLTSALIIMIFRPFDIIIIIDHCFFSVCVGSLFQLKIWYIVLTTFVAVSRSLGKLYAHICSVYCDALTVRSQIVAGRPQQCFQSVGGFCAARCEAVWWY